MNLLIEQRPTTITSSKSQQQKSQISNHHDVNNGSSSSSSSTPLVVKIKRHTTRHPHDSTSTSSPMPADDDNDSNSRSTSDPPRSKRPTSNTSTRRPSSPAFNGKQQQATKRSVTIDNNNNDLPSTTTTATTTTEDISTTKRFKRDDLNSSSSKVDASVETVSVGLATEPDHLGPCEPGTSVVLEGIVWNETDSGVLVVNVTWRGKTYVGTLLDSTKQDWACPRLTCESPTSDYDARTSSKSGRSKRTSASGTTSRCANQQQQSLTSFQQITSAILASGADDRKLRHNIKSRQSKRLNNLPASSADESTANSSPLTSPYPSNQTFFPPETSTDQSASNLEPQLIPCSESHCHKRFTSSIALSYHLSNAHQPPQSTSSTATTTTTTTTTTMTSTTVSQASTRDEEDVAHILANVAHYARRSSPPSSVQCSPEHQRQALPSPAIVHSPPSTTLTWPCPQITSKFVLSSSLNNSERTLSPNHRNESDTADLYSSTNTLENKIATDQDDLKPSSLKPTDRSILSIEEETHSSRQTSPVSMLHKNGFSPSPPPAMATSVDASWTNGKKDRNTSKKRSKVPTPPPPPLPPPSSIIPADIPATASSPAYSDISDEDPTTTGEQILQPSTINLLAVTNEKLDENGNNLPSASFLPSNHSDISNPAWTAQMLFQQFGSYMSQSALIPASATAVPSTHPDASKKPREPTPNGSNSKTTCPSSNGTSDSTVKNILDARRTSASKPSLSPPSTLYHFHTNGTNNNETKFSPSVINTLTSPNENLLHTSTAASTVAAAAATTATSTTASTAIKPVDILDYSLNNSRSTNGGPYHHSSSLHPSR